MLKPTKDFLEIFKSTDGALSVTESIAIMNIAAQVPEGAKLELGSYKGKSAMSAAMQFKGKFTLLEPECNNYDLMEELLVNVAQFMGKPYLVIPVADYSVNFLTQTNDEYAYVFVDSGSHQDGLPMQEVKLLEDRIVPHGIIAFHDYKSQFIEVEEAYNYLLSTGKYEEINIDWNEIIEYVNENNLEENNKSWHHNELKNPCFVGALRRK